MIGKAILPEAALVHQFPQQRKSKFSVANFCEANNQLKEVKALKPIVSHKSPGKSCVPAACSFSDTECNMSETQSYEQSGILRGIVLDDDSHSPPIFRALD